MRIISKISLLIVVCIFLFSTTGLLVIQHKCDTCNISEILIIKKHSHKESQHTEQNCCLGMSCNIDTKQVDQDDPECCTEEPFYIKVTEPYLSLSSAISFNLKVCQLLSGTKINLIGSKLTHQILYTSVIKPPDLSGRDILRNNCILRV